MVRLFIGTLKGVAFDWFRSLPSGSIKSWIDLETRFLSRFYEDDIEVIMDMLLSTVQKGGESVREYIKRFHNLSSCVLRACRYLYYSRHVSITFLTE